MAPTAQAAPAVQTKFTLDNFVAVADSLPDLWLVLNRNRILSTIIFSLLLPSQKKRGYASQKMEKKW